MTEAPPAHRQRVQLVRRLELGAPGSGAEFGLVVDVAVDSRRNVLVLDQATLRIARFDSLGHPTGAVGGRGDGPAEFRQAWRLMTGLSDSLWVYDIATGRFTVIDSDLRVARVIATPLHWNITEFQQHPSGLLVIAALDLESMRTIHVMDPRDGRVLRSFREIERPPTAIKGYEHNLIGGKLDITPSGGILYTQFSPYQLELYDLDGVQRWSCSDPTVSLSRPEDLIENQADRQRLHWNRFVRSGSVFALSDSLFLNIVTDPTNDRRQFDLVNRSCGLVSRRVLDVPMLLTKRDQRRTRFVGGLSLEVPIVAVYDLRLIF